MYNDYKHLIGLPYISGKQDCYGLVRTYCKDVYNLDLTNFARPDRFWDDPRMNILSDLLHVDGWEDISVSLRNLVTGDVLVFSIITGRANHLGIYVGNGLFIHHGYGRFSSEESIGQKWMSRCLGIVRHPAVKKINQSKVTTTDALELRRKLFGASNG